MTDERKKGKYKIVYIRKDCIGAAACAAVAQEFWTMDESDDGKADIPKAKKPETDKDGNQILYFNSEEDLEKNVEAATNCPVNVIHIYNVETGKRLM